jgi:hypothetical protein
MGEAKNRGNKEERIAQAIIRNEEIEKKLLEERSIKQELAHIERSKKVNVGTIGHISNSSRSSIRLGLMASLILGTTLGGLK